MPAPPDVAAFPTWYPLAAAVLMLAVQLVRTDRRLSKYWKAIKNGWRFLPPTLAGALIGALGELVRAPSLAGCLTQALYGAVGIGGLAMGGAAALKESPLRWDGGAGGAPPGPKSPSVTVISALGLLTLLATGCFRESYPCDEGTALALAAECTAKYEACREAGHPDACPEADACEQKALERDDYCVKRIRSGQ